MSQTPNGSDTARAAEVAAYLHMSVARLAALRYTGDGPKFVRIGKRGVLYRWSDVYDYLDGRAITRTDDPIRA